ncbi:uncharacterized protein LOC144707895 [Wolffia australiana]
MGLLEYVLCGVQNTARRESTALIRLSPISSKSIPAESDFRKKGGRAASRWKPTLVVISEDRTLKASAAELRPGKIIAAHKRRAPTTTKKSHMERENIDRNVASAELFSVISPSVFVF